MWEHTLVCLPSTTQCSPPGPHEPWLSVASWTRRKDIEFFDSNDAEMLYEDLLEAFPKLCAGRGYELLCTNEQSLRSLDVIPHHHHLSVTNLSNVADGKHPSFCSSVLG